MFTITLRHPMSRGVTLQPVRGTRDCAGEPIARGEGVPSLDNVLLQRRLGDLHHGQWNT